MRAIRTATEIVALLAGGVGCAAQSENKLLPHEARAQIPPAIQDACVLAEQKCSTCHDLGRLSVARWNGVTWETYVERMRRLPGSGFSLDDGKTIVTCLNYVKRLQTQSSMVQADSTQEQDDMARR
jgi:hypothetical protein